MSALSDDLLHPHVSRPASDFGRGAERRALPLPDLDGLTAAGTLHVLCPRPVHHVLDYDRLVQVGAQLRAHAPALSVRLHVRSDLDDWTPFERLPFDDVVRLPRDDERPRLAEHLDGLRGTVWLLSADDGWAAAMRQHASIRFLGSTALGHRSAFFLTPAAAEAARAFQRALLAESPRWVARADAPTPPTINSTNPRFLVHQARFHIGDTLWLTPLLRAIGRQFPGARTTVVGPPVATDVLAGNHDVAEVVPYPEDGSAADRERVLDALAGHRFDAAFLAFARRPESVWLARALAVMDVPVRINLEYFDPDLDPRIIAPWATHEGWFFWGAMASPAMLLHALDPLRPVDQDPCRDRRVVFSVTDSARRRSKETLASHDIDGPFAILAPGGHSSERWPAERFAALAARLVDERGLGVVLTGAPDETQRLERIARASRSPRVVVATDPLDVLAALLERAAFLVSNDSAPIHLAEAVATPTLYFAQREKLVHAHPAGERCWALFDDIGNDLRQITLDQVTRALDDMLSQAR